MKVSLIQLFRGRLNECTLEQIIQKSNFFLLADFSRPDIEEIQEVEIDPFLLFFVNAISDSLKCTVQNRPYREYQCQNLGISLKEGRLITT